MLSLVDSHCHLDFPAFDAIRDQELALCQQHGVESIVLPAVTADTWGRLLALGQSSDMLYSSLGLHPYFMSQHDMSHLELLEQELGRHDVVAVGEIGLDFFLKDLPVEQQFIYFERQLDIARNVNLPVILHVRKAYDEVLKLLRRYRLPKGGVVHAFSGSEQQARQLIELGFKLGFGGAVTWDRALKLRRLVADLPLESIVLETDAPDMPPAFIQKGDINRPHYLERIAREIASIRELSPQLLAEQTSINARELFSLG